jgi:predicted TIM-barrel fold metal-dependent hydrolase
MEMIYSLAQDYNVPVLMHFQFDMFNLGFERLGKVMDKWHKVTFIAHSVGFWTNIDAGLAGQAIGYPPGKIIKPGGLSDRYLSDHANFYGDLSAGSGLNALTRDEDHARGFLDRHQDKLLYGSDCADPAGFGPTCIGANIISAVKRLAPSKAIERKLLFGNANKMFRLT